MNSDSCSEQEKDTYGGKSSGLAPWKPRFSSTPVIYGGKPINKPSLQMQLQPIPVQLFLPSQYHLPNGSFLYTNIVPKAHHFPKFPKLKNQQNQNQNTIVYLCIHGAGHSALVFGHLAKQMRNNKKVIFCYDIMCHGKSTANFMQVEMTIENLVKQGIQVMQYIRNQWKYQKFVLIGHSLGGSIITRIADQLSKINGKQQKLQIHGVVMIDTIQGAALKSTQEMLRFIEQRPPTFQSLQSAIKWNYKAGCVRRLESARYSVPSFFIEASNSRHRWRTDLIQTRGLWEQWFKGVSLLFNNLKCAKIMMTASKFRLDQILLEGFVENKFNLELFEYSGHNIQEDQYQKVARTLLKYFDNQFKNDKPI